MFGFAFSRWNSCIVWEGTWLVGQLDNSLFIDFKVENQLMYVLNELSKQNIEEKKMMKT